LNDPEVRLNPNAAWWKMATVSVIAESTPHAGIAVTEDGYTAYLWWGPQTDLHSFSENELTHLLEDAGIVFGVRKNLAQVIGDASDAEGRLVVAEGIRPVEGASGWVEYRKKTERAEENSNKEQKVDFHSLDWIQNVQESQTVAVLHPSEPGVPGTTVTGKTVACSPVKEAEFRLGKNVARHHTEPHTIVATVDGNLQIAPGGGIEVEPLITVRGDVDYSTGDLDFVGAVVVTGDVKSGFSVKAKQSIEVRGNVEDATVQSDGDIIIQKGFVGQGKGVVDAKGNVTVQRVLNQTITSGIDTTVMREAVGAKIRAGQRIVSPNATFVGCMLEAGKKIEVLSLGIGDKGQAKARVGRRGAILERLNANDKETIQIQKQLSDIKEVIYKLVRAELDNGSLTSEQQEAHATLRRLQPTLQKALDAHSEEKEMLKIQLTETASASIVIHDTLFSNVFVELNGVKKLFQNSLKEVLLTERAGKIEERSLS
jgi:uncharacterized protein